MAYTLRIVFGGLCALVPREMDNKLEVLLVNTQNSRASRLSNKPPLHYPMLTFNLRDLSGGGPAATQGIWRLQFEDLSISAQSVSKPLEFGNLSVVQSGGTKGNTDFSWIPSLQSICPGAGKVEPDCLAANPSTDLASAFILARLSLDKGLAGVNQVANFRGAEVMTEFVPKAPGSTISRTALPHLGQVLMDIDDGQTVTITSRRFDGKPPGRTLSLGPAPTNGEIEILVTNLCCGGYQTVDPNRRPQQDDDFECFYTLCANFDDLLQELPQLPIPVPVDFAPKPSPLTPVGGGATGIECSMTRMMSY